MSDPLAFRQALGVAYGLRHSAAHGRAVSYLREATADPEQRELAVAHREQLRAVVMARSIGPDCGCYVSKTTFDLLTEALDV